MQDTALIEPQLSLVYRAYIDCLNLRNWDDLGRFVHDDVRHNGKALGLSGYRAMLEQDCRDIPDLRFVIELLVGEAPHIAARLHFDCTPAGRFLGLPIEGRTISFAENVFYRFENLKIVTVWSVLDKMAIEAQL